MQAALSMNISADRESSLGALILAGGRSRRLEDKCFRILRNKELILHVFGRVGTVVDEIVVALRNQEQVDRLRNLLPTSQIVLDENQNEGPLIGLLSGLSVIKTPYVFAAACDTPFIEPNVLRLLHRRAIENDGAIPVWDDGRLEPLCAVYCRDSAMQAAKRSVETGNMSMLGMIGRLDKLMRVPVEEFRKIDPHLLTFRNINTPEDLEWAERAIQRNIKT